MVGKFVIGAGAGLTVSALLMATVSLLVPVAPGAGHAPATGSEEAAAAEPPARTGARETPPSRPGMPSPDAGPSVAPGVPTMQVPPAVEPGVAGFGTVPETGVDLPASAQDEELRTPAGEDDDARPAARESIAPSGGREAAEVGAGADDAGASGAVTGQDAGGQAASITGAAAGISVPAGSQFAARREDGPVVTPDRDGRPRVAFADGPQVGEGPGAVPAPDTDPAAQPEEAEVVTLAAPPDEGAAPDRPMAIEEGPRRTFGTPAGPSTGDAGSDAPAMSSDDALRDPAPATATDSDEPALTDGAPAAARAAALRSETVPRADLGDGDVGTASDAEMRGAPARDSRASAGEDGAADLIASGTVSGDALTAHAEPLDNSDGLPLLSIVLVVDPAGGVAPEDLAAILIPVTYAVDPARADAVEQVELFRSAGHEVLLTTDHSVTGDTGEPPTAAVAEPGAQRAEGAPAGAVGLLGPRLADGGAEALSPDVMARLSEDGMGLLLYPSGPETEDAPAIAGEAPAAEAFRVLDANGQSAPEITRALDRATYEAIRTGGVAVVALASSETVTALYSWAFGRRAETVAVAPISHFLQRSADD